MLHSAVCVFPGASTFAGIPFSKRGCGFCQPKIINRAPPRSCVFDTFGQYRLCGAAFATTFARTVSTRVTACTRVVSSAQGPWIVFAYALPPTIRNPISRIGFFFFFVKQRGRFLRRVVLASGPCHWLKTAPPCGAARSAPRYLFSSLRRTNRNTVKQHTWFWGLGSAQPLASLLGRENTEIREARTVPASLLFQSGVVSKPTSTTCLCAARLRQACREHQPCRQRQC